MTTDVGIAQLRMDMEAAKDALLNLPTLAARWAVIAEVCSRIQGNEMSFIEMHVKGLGDKNSK